MVKGLYYWPMASALDIGEGMTSCCRFNRFTLFICLGASLVGVEGLTLGLRFVGSRL